MAILDALRKAPASPDGPDEDFVDLSQIKLSVAGGRKGNRKAGVASPESPPVTEKDAEEKILDSLLTTDNFEGVVSLPFNLRYVMTGYKEFLLSQKQKDALAGSLTASFRLLVKIDPRWLAVGLTVVNFASIYAEKEIAWQLQQKKEKAGKEK